MTRPIKLVVGGAVALAILIAGGTWVFFTFIEDDAPDKFSLTSDDSTAVTGGSSSSGVDGTWKVSTGSEAGYRVKEILFGQDNTAAGRTSDVTGTVTIDGTKATAAKVTVDLTTVTSDQDRRDAQFQGRIMDTANFPTATFELTEPADFGSLPPEGKVVTVKASGKLTLHGTTKTVTVDLQTKRSADSIQVVGSIPILFADYGIPNPSFGPISTEDHGELEFSLVLEKT
jgi:polyisoprenoid-binding protein YceI